MGPKGYKPHIVRHKSHRQQSILNLRLAGFGILLVLFLGLFSYTRGNIYYTRAGAQSANTLNFQARLLGASGAIAADGNYHVEFKLYNAATGGTPLWTETRTAGTPDNRVTVKGGYLSVYLGDVTAFPSIDWSQQHWLTMNIGGKDAAAAWDGEMTPRIKLTAVPYAFRANQANSLTNGSGTITADNLLHKAPLNLQSLNASVAGLRFNQTGTGGLIQLQGDGADVFTVSKTGAGFLKGSLDIDGAFLDIGAAAQAGALVLSDGTSNTGTLQTAALAANRTYTLPDADGTFVLDTTLGNNYFAQNGNSFGGLATLGTNDNFGLAFETNGTAKMTILANGNVGIGTSGTPGALLSIGGTSGNLTVDTSGNILAAFTTLNGSSTTNGGTLSASTSMTLTDATNFDVGNYIKVDSTGCASGVNNCYAKITAKSSNTLTISPGLIWASGATVTETHVPEIGGTDLTQALANRYGRGYFIDGIVTGNGSTYYSDGLMSSQASTFNLLNSNVTTLNIGGAATTINLGASGTTVALPGTLSIGGTNRLDASGNLINIASLTGSGALTIASGGGGDLILDSASNKLVIAASDTTLQRTAAGSYTIDLNDSGATSLVLNNSGTGAAGLNLSDGGLQTAGLSRLTNAGALENITGLTIISGGANITGATNLLKTGTATSTTQYASSDLKFQASGWDTSLNAGAGGESLNNFSLRNTGLSGAGGLYRFGLVNQAGTEVLSVRESGNIGIGVTDPATALELRKSTGPVIRLGLTGEAVTGQLGGIEFRNGNNLYMSKIESHNPSGFYTDQTDLRFFTTYQSMGERMRIDPEGRVSIGTTGASARLHVNTGRSDWIGQIIQGVGSQTADLLQIKSDTATLLKVGAAGNLDLTGGGLQTVGTTRLTNGGALQNITGLTFISGSLNLNSGGITNAGAVSGVTTLTASGNINTTGGTLQTNTIDRIDNAGNLVNVGNITGSGPITVTSTGAGNNITLNAGGSIELQDSTLIKPGVDSATAFQVQKANGAELFVADTSNSKVSIKGDIHLTAAGGAAAPVLSAGANTGGSLSGSSSTTYFYVVTAMVGGVETSASAEASINGSGFTPINAPGTAPAVAAGNNGGITGTFTYQVTFVTANGETTGSPTSASITVSNKKVDVSGIATGPAGTTARKLYRIASGGSVHKLVTTISDNTTTTYTDSTADSSLGADIPTSNSARTDTNNVTVNFSSVTGATEYRIYRGTSPRGQDNYQVATTSPFTDTGSGGTAGTPPASAIPKLGIGTTTPGNKLSVNNLSIADSAAQVAIGTGGAGNKGLIIQGAASQTADLLQVQSSTGTVLAKIDSAGNLTAAGIIVGTNGTQITQMKVYTPTLDPAGVSAGTTAEQTYTVTGLTLGDTVYINKPSLTANCMIVNVRVSAADTLAISWANISTLTACNPPSEVYRVMAIRS